MAESANIKTCAEALASLDVASALAHLAVERDYARPQVDDSHAFVVEGGRHPLSSRLCRGMAVLCCKQF